MIDSTAAGVSEAKIKNRPFGAVDLTKDHFLFIQKPPSQGNCLLYFISFTPRGHDRSLIGKVDGEVWKMISKQTAEELARGMDKREKNGQALKFVNGENVLSPLPGRELAVLFWALLEDDTKKYTREIYQGWQSLAREERWWLYAKASSPGQKKGMGWRRALYFALGGPPAEPQPDIVKQAKPKKKVDRKKGKAEKQLSLLDLNHKK